MRIHSTKSNKGVTRDVVAMLLRGNVCVDKFPCKLRGEPKRPSGMQWTPMLVDGTFIRLVPDIESSNYYVRYVDAVSGDKVVDWYGNHGVPFSLDRGTTLFIKYRVTGR